MLNATACRPAARSFSHAVESRSAGLACKAHLQRPARDTRGDSRPATALSERVACHAASRAIATSRGFGHWRSREDQQLGVEELIEDGAKARQAVRASAPRLESWRSSQRAQADDQLLKSVAAQRQLRADLVAGSMKAGLEQTLMQARAGQATGVRDALLRLNLRHGDRVAEIDPVEFSLPVALAAHGCQVTLIHSDPDTCALAHQEVSALREGRVRGGSSARPDGKGAAPSPFIGEHARHAGAALNVQAGDTFDTLRGHGTWRALISRGTLGFREPDEAIRMVQQAARLLAPGGALVFQLAHEAGDEERFGAGWTRRRLSMETLEAPARRAGLVLKLAHVGFASPGIESRELLPTRKVTPECTGWVDFVNVDAAAWNAWEHLQQEPWVREQPMTVEVSGMLLRLPSA